VSRLAEQKKAQTMNWWWVHRMDKAWCSR